jgi:PAS domain S-box-containing protein
MSTKEALDRPGWSLRVSAGLGAYAMLGGLLSLLGWVLDVQRFTDWDGSGISIQPNAALCAALAGASLILLNFGLGRVAAMLGMLVAAIAGITLFEHLSGVSLGIDTLLMFGHAWGSSSTVAPGRMGPPASLMWTLIGSSIVLSQRGSGARRSVCPLALIVVGIAALSLTGYLFGADPLFTLPKLTAIALQTATFVLAAGLALIASVPEHDPMRTLMATNGAAIIARRLLPFVIVLPLILGWLRLDLQRRGLADLEFGTALRTIVEVILLAGLLWWATRAIGAHERALHAAAAARVADAARISEQKELLSVTLGSIGDGVIVTDTGGRITFMNPVAEQLTGWTLSECVGQRCETVFKIIGEASRRPVESPVAKVLRLGVSAGLENHTLLVRKDGNELPVDDSGAPIRDAEGKVFGAVLVFRDFTDRRTIERALLDREEFVRGILGSITDSFYVLDNDWRFSFANDEMLQRTGKSLSETIGSSIWQTFPEAVGSEAQTQLRRAMGERVSVEFDVFYVPEQRWFHAKAYPTAAGGLAVYSRDVTERKQAAEFLRQRDQSLAAELASARRLQELSTQLIVHSDDTPALYERILDTAVEIMDSDFASIQMLYPERGDGGELRLLSHRGFNARAAAFWEWVRPTAESTCGVALRSATRVVVPDVDACDFMAGSADLEISLAAGIHAVQTTPLLSRQGRIVGMISTHWRTPHQPTERDLRLLDIVARQAADVMERKQVEDGLREADRRKDQFLATLAHELRNPLAPMRNALEIMKRAKDDRALIEETRATLDRQMAHMVRLVDDLLDLSRISHDKLELRRGRVGLASIIHQAVESVRPVADQKRQQVTIDLPSETVYVDGDSTRLVQVFGNLLSNACKYTPSGGRIAIAVERRPGSWAVATVADAGIGIPPHMLENVFQMFTQVERSFDGSGGGLGIGLHLVKRLVELHGGTVSAHSGGENKGSTFTVRLPMLIAKSQEKAPEPMRGEARNQGLSGQRILIVDDNKDAAETMECLLMLEGHSTQTAHDGLQALEAVDRFDPEVVLLDIGLPGMNGYDVCRAIRGKPSSHKRLIVALTGWGQATDRQRSIAAGFDEHLVKPLNFEALTKLLDAQRSDDEDGPAIEPGPRPVAQPRPQRSS